ncbi:hypothetical protein PanWU01x14_253860 [Parasponia andersonii]|uniref:Uncharacterized protein n=1 Tax=Parasponia andersonii TaxID=3476 RepID=A0A2P5BBJ0_PARAD|nr:hypothetical protein PanWU01x14_253860 [Parasponia andersonii]
MSLAVPVSVPLQLIQARLGAASTETPTSPEAPPRFGSRRVRGKRLWWPKPTRSRPSFYRSSSPVAMIFIGGETLTPGPAGFA